MPAPTPSTNIEKAIDVGRDLLLEAGSRLSNGEPLHLALGAVAVFTGLLANEAISSSKEDSVGIETETQPKAE